MRNAIVLVSSSEALSKMSLLPTILNEMGAKFEEFSENCLNRERDKKRTKELRQVEII